MSRKGSKLGSLHLTSETEHKVNGVAYVYSI